MVGQDELRRLAEADRERRQSEMLALRAKIKDRAVADFAGWKQCIEYTIKKGGSGYISLNNLGDDWEADNRKKAPFVDTVGLIFMASYLAEIYAAKLQELLGEPFHVEAKWNESRYEGEGYNTFTVSW